MWRGTLLHEIINLPLYWKEVAQAPSLSFPVEKLTFGDHARQYCLLVRPASQPRAWVVYWHGGGWQFGSPEQFRATAQAWLSAGYGVIMPSYRRLPNYRFPAIRQDAINALAACRKYWQERGEGFPEVLLLGMSAGGHLASLAALDADILEQAGWQPPQIRGVIACGGVMDFSVMRNNPSVRMLAGSPQQARFQQANPLTHLNENSPPFLLVHGTKDGMVPYQAAVNFKAHHERHRAPGNCELITLPAGTHLDAARWMFQDSPLRQRVFQQAEKWLAS